MQKNEASCMENHINNSHECNSLRPQLLLYGQYYMDQGYKAGSQIEHSIFSVNKSKQNRRINQKLRRRRRAHQSGHASSSSFESSFSGSHENVFPGSFVRGESAPFHMPGSSGRSSPTGDVATEWQRLKDLASQWLTLYRYHGFRHSMLRELLFAERVAEFSGRPDGKEELVVSSDSLEAWLESRKSVLRTGDDADACIRAILDKLESGLSLLTSLTDPSAPTIPVAPKKEAREPTPPTAENSDVQCTVNGITINLSFKNSGNNDINDIETYLQEKLDVLEFLQMDCNKIAFAGTSPPTSPRRALASQTRVLAPKINITTRPQSAVNESASLTYLSVGDWYSATAPPSFPDQSSLVADASDESRFIKATQVSTMSRGGFFIGTPTSRNIPSGGGLDVSFASSVGDSNSSFLVDEENIKLHEALNDSQLKWETDSSRGLTSARLRDRSSSSRAYARRRSTSVSSVSSSGPSWPTRRMMPLQQRRSQRKQIHVRNDDMSNDDDSFQDENQNSENMAETPASAKQRYIATGWWN